MTKNELIKYIKKLKNIETINVDEHGKVIILVVELKNLESGRKLNPAELHCSKCGAIITKAKKNGELICNDCYKIKRREDVRINVARNRIAKKEKEIKLFGVRQRGMQ